VQTPQIKVPATDFDFESSNAKFDKAALTPRSASAAGKEGDVAGECVEESENGKEKEKEKETTEKEKEKEKEVLIAYNPQKSFFDSLSSSTAPPPLNGGANGGGGRGGARRGGGRGGGGMARNRREEERERNVATFGEPGGVGLMGPGAYVGGWGGYGRRGGRPRRGGPAVGGPVHQQAPTRV
jgi:protein LSM14